LENILVISHHLIPYTPSYGQIARQLTLVNHLAKHYNVHIITVRGKKVYDDFGFVFDEKIKFHYVDDPNYVPVENSISIRGNGRLSKLFFVLSKYGVSYSIKLIFGILKNIVVLDRYEFPGVNNFFKEASRIIENNKISKIMVMTPPYSFHKLTYLLKNKFSQIPLILDVQDSWVVPALTSKRTISASRSRIYESKSIRYADKIVFNGPLMKKHYDEYYNIDYKTKLLMNGFDCKNEAPKKEIQVSKLNLSDKVLNIGYFGKAHIGNNDYFRDIRKFFDFLKYSKDDFNDKLNLDFYGYFSGDHNKWKKHVPYNYIGVLDYNEVSYYMGKYDCLLIYHSDEARAEEVLTGKVFEYLSVRKPVIVLGPQNMLEARNLIEKNNLGVFININDPEDMRKKLLFLGDLKNSGKINEYFNRDFDVNQYDRKIINESYLKFIKKV
jgi:glycosyltransferase involved in cell wall biosynthesis